MKNLLKALAGFQQEVPVIFKETSGFGYKYADLPTIFNVINPLLKKHGLVFTQLVNRESLKTILFHVESGESLESETMITYGVQLSKMNDFQVLGSQITYLRRYALSSILGLVTDVDNDAGGDQVKPEKQYSEEISWLSEKQKNNFLQMINDGKVDIVKTQLEKGTYKIRKNYLDEIREAIKNSEVGSFIFDNQKLIDAINKIDVIGSVQELEKHWEENPEYHTQETFKLKTTRRKKELLTPDKK